MGSTNWLQVEINAAAANQCLREGGMRSTVDGSVVEWDSDDSNVRPGPNATDCEAKRKDCGTHLQYSAFGICKAMQA